MAKTKPTVPASQCPKHLSPEMAAWWATVVDEYELGDHHFRILETACESWDTMRSALEIIRQEGLMYTNRFGEPRQHPAVAMARDARTSFLRSVRELALDHAEETPRPPAIRRAW